MEEELQLEISGTFEDAKLSISFGSAEAEIEESEPVSTETEETTEVESPNEAEPEEPETPETTEASEPAEPDESVEVEAEVEVEEEVEADSEPEPEVEEEEPEPEEGSFYIGPKDLDASDADDVGRLDGPFEDYVTAQQRRAGNPDREVYHENEIEVEEPAEPETPTEQVEETPPTAEGDASVSAAHPMRAEPDPEADEESGEVDSEPEPPEEDAEDDEDEAEYDTDIPDEVRASFDKADEAKADDSTEAASDDVEEESQYDAEDEDVPPLSADTKQFSVAKKVLDQNGEWVRVRQITDELKTEEGEDEWNDSKTTSHLYSVMDKGIVERKKDDESGKYVYRVTDLGETAIEQALKDAERWDAEAKAAT